MGLLNNTVIFLDAGFFREIRTVSSLHTAFFQYAKDDKIKLCSCDVALEEYRTYRLDLHNKFVGRVTSDGRESANKNPFTDLVLSMHAMPQFPNETETEELSIRWLNDFIRENKIDNFEPTPEQLKRTMWAYFRGKPPFSYLKARKDIPDGWIYEVARDLKDNPSHAAHQNRFCMGSDRAFKDHLTALGLIPIETVELVERLKQEEATQAAETAGADTAPYAEDRPAFLRRAAPGEATVEEHNQLPPAVISAGMTTLEQILATAFNQEQRQVYLRVMGYISWMDSPSKIELIRLVAGRGHSEEMVRAACAILSQPDLGLITDSGNHYLAKNDDILGQAAEVIMPEILEVLDTWQ
jgi:hypothetical protein